MSDKQIHESIQTWDTIADSFDKTRKNPWAQVNEYIASLSSHSFLIDLGCGNGRHLIPAILHCGSVVGFDISRRMLEISSEKIMGTKTHDTSFVQGTLYALPFIDKKFDAALCIASVHNIKNREFRQTCFKEIYRILRSNGTALISVWSREQNRFKDKILAKPKGTDAEFGDVDLYWRQDNLDIPRFYHLYSLKEFREDIEAGGFTIQSLHAEKITSQHQADNYFAIVKRRE